MIDGGKKRALTRKRAAAPGRFQLQTGMYVQSGGTLGIVLKPVDLAFRRELRRERAASAEGKGGTFSCITRAGQHSSVPIEQAWLLQPRTMPGTRYCARALLFHRFVPFSFDPRMRYIPHVCSIAPTFLSERRSFSFSYILPRSSPRYSCTPYFALLSIILDRRRRCSRRGRRIDFRLPRSRHRPSQS